jgi:hypothetical protein
MFLINVNYCMYVLACLVKLLISSLDPLAGRHLGLIIMSNCIEFNSNHLNLNLNLLKPTPGNI